MPFRTVSCGAPPKSAGLTRFDRQRFALIDSLPERTGGRFIFAPHSATIDITRRCLSLCPHCAPESHPQSNERLTRGLIKNFLIGLEEIPVTTLFVEGGEPLMAKRLVHETFRDALCNENLMQFVLETNAFWADSPERTRGILSGFSELGFEEHEKRFVATANIDAFHRPRSPFENIINLINSFYDFFPNGEIGLSHSKSPGDNSVFEFIDMLKAEGLFIEAEYKDSAHGKAVTQLSVEAGGQQREIGVQNKYPVLVGRARQFRNNDYLQWEYEGRGERLNLHQHHSIPFKDRYERGVELYLSLGWNGLLFGDVMFMHTQTYPIGDVRTDNVYEAIMRANKDPLFLRLQTLGLGSIYRVARRVDPSLEDVDPRLLVEDLMIDVLSDPERNLEILKGIIKEDEEGVIPKGCIPAGIPAGEAIDRLLQMDWTGVEHKFVDRVSGILADLSPEEIAALIAEKDLKGDDCQIMFSVIVKNGDKQQANELLKLAAANPRILNKMFTGHLYIHFDQRQKAFAESYFAAIVQNDRARSEELNAQLNDIALLKMADELLATLFELKAGRLVTDMFDSLSSVGKSTFLSRFAEDEGVISQFFSELFGKHSMGYVQDVIDLVPEAEVRFRLCDLLRSIF